MDTALATAPKTNGSAELVAATGWTIKDIISADEIRRMPIGMRIDFVPELRAHFEQQAREMAESDLTREHLRGKPAECLSIIRNSLNWGMDARQVAAKTYAPGKGQIGIEGVLASAIMYSSGRVSDITYEYQGDWAKIQGQWAYEQLKWPNGRLKTYKNGDPIFGNVSKWKPEDEQGLTVVGIAKLTNGKEVRTPEIALNECHPRNAQTWPTRPKAQIIHVVERVLCNMICGDILMGVHIDVGLQRWFEDGNPGEPEMRDITPPRDTAPKAVDPQEEGISGGGETRPGTPSGMVEAAKPKSAAGDDAEATERAPVEKITLEFRGKEYQKTAFRRDIKQMIADCPDLGELDALAIEISDAKEAAKGDAPRLWAEVNEAIASARAKLEPEEDGDGDGDDSPPYDPQGGFYDDTPDDQEVEDLA